MGAYYSCIDKVNHCPLSLLPRSPCLGCPGIDILSVSLETRTVTNDNDHFEKLDSAGCNYKMVHVLNSVLMALYCQSMANYLFSYSHIPNNRTYTFIYFPKYRRPIRSY